MKRYKVSITITIVAVLLAVAHLIFPNVEIDNTTLILLVIAVLPWLAPIFKSVELPGGLKIEFQELEKAREEAVKAGLLSVPREKKEEPIYISVAPEDPNLALAGLRIDIERRLRAIAKAKGIDTERQTIGQLLRRLSANEAISEEQYSVLSDLIALLNRAVHGAEVEPGAAQWAIDIGPGLLAAFDERLAADIKAALNNQ